MKKGLLQETVVDLVTRITRANKSKIKAPPWLVRPGKVECGDKWMLVQKIYTALTDLILPDVMPPREWRWLDAILVHDSAAPRILEVDESQHFNKFRAVTLSFYTGNVRLAFDAQQFLDASKSKSRLQGPGSGFGDACPPLFPGDGGRHRQRAFRDALVDILPVQYGYAPTLRIAHFEVEGWILNHDAEDRMRILLGDRLKTDP